MSFETISPEKKNVLPLVESYSINKSFICDSTVVLGQAVKLNTDGTVTPVTAATDVPIGIVVAPNRADDTRITVQTFFSAVVLGVADSTVTTGNVVAITGNTAGANKFKTAIATYFVVGIALTTATNTNAVYVGLLRSPYLMGVTS